MAVKRLLLFGIYILRKPAFSHRLVILAITVKYESINLPCTVKFSPSKCLNFGSFHDSKLHRDTYSSPNCSVKSNKLHISAEQWKKHHHKSTYNVWKALEQSKVNTKDGKTSTQSQHTQNSLQKAWMQTEPLNTAT